MSPGHATEERARQRELRNAGVVAARDARQKLARAVEILDADSRDAASVQLAVELSSAVGALFGCEIGDAGAVLDKLRGASAVLSGVLARLHGPAIGSRLDEAGELVAASLAVLYPVRAGLERDLVEQQRAAAAQANETPSRRPATGAPATGAPATGSDRPRTFTVRGSSARPRDMPTMGEPLAPDDQAELEAVRVLSSQAGRTLVDLTPPVHDASEPSARGQVIEHVAAPLGGPVHVDDAGMPRDVSSPGRPISVRPLPLIDRRPPVEVQTLLGMSTDASEVAAAEVAPIELTGGRASLEARALFPDAGDDALPPLLLMERSSRRRRRALELVADGQGDLIDAASGENRVSSGAERRIQDRVEMEVDIGLHSATQFYAGLSNDISEGGIFVSTVKPMPVGSQLSITFVLPGGHTVSTRGRVAWLSSPRDDDGRPGMGVRFERLEDEHRHAIEKFLRYRPAMLHEV